ncbi:MAG: MBL fold metallo-hydrolase [Elusimicrobiota bacterium]|jgi:hypothetical protein|nr:MBL fold metallo-hydrolase [Elusimicrobiota bacterium]
MKKNNFEVLTLKKGAVTIYDFGEIKLHAYQTNNPLGDELFVLEKNGKAVIIEAPLFYENIKELEEYVKSLNVSVEGLFLSYHMAAGASFLSDVKRYSTKTAYEAASKGYAKELIKNFANSFGNLIDPTTNTVTNYVKDNETVSVAGIKVIIRETREGFDIILPEINAVYLHMMGHDVHSIVAGNASADEIIAQLSAYVKEGYDLILSSHYIAEDRRDIETKIAYLKKLKKIAAKSASRDKFKSSVKKAYPDYTGENYLDMTAQLFFPA